MNLNVTVCETEIEDAIATLVESPLSDIKYEMEEYVDACIDRHVDENHAEIQDTISKDVVGRLDDLTMRLENIEATVKHLYTFKLIAAKDLSRFRKLRNVLADFVHFSAPTDEEVQSHDDR